MSGLSEYVYALAVAENNVLYVGTDKGVYKTNKGVLYAATADVTAKTSSLYKTENNVI